MRKSPNIAIFLALLLLLAPFAQAETIQIINYIPRLPSQKHQASDYDHKQSVQRINLLLDNLKEEINQEFGSQAEVNHQESTEESESQKKQSEPVDRSEKKHPMKPSLRTEGKLKSKENKEQDEDSSSQSDTKIVKEKLDDIINVMKSTAKPQNQEQQKPKQKAENSQIENRQENAHKEQKQDHKREEKIEKEPIPVEKETLTHDKMDKKVIVEQPAAASEINQDQKHEQIKIIQHEQTKHTQVHQQPLKITKNEIAQEVTPIKTEVAEHPSLPVHSQIQKEPVNTPAKVDLVQSPVATHENADQRAVTAEPTGTVETVQQQVHTLENSASSHQIESSKADQSPSQTDEQKVIAITHEPKEETSVTQESKEETSIPEEPKEEKSVPQEPRQEASLEAANIPQASHQESGQLQEQIAAVQPEQSSQPVIEITANHTLPLLPETHHEPEALVSALHVEVEDHQESAQITEKEAQSTSSHPAESSVEQQSTHHESDKTEAIIPAIVGNEGDSQEELQQQPSISLTVEHNDSSATDHQSIEQEKVVTPTAQAQDKETMNVETEHEGKSHENGGVSLITEAETHNSQAQSEVKNDVTHVSLAENTETLNEEPTVTTISQEHAIPLDTTKTITSQEHVTIPIETSETSSQHSTSQTQSQHSSSSVSSSVDAASKSSLRTENSQETVVVDVPAASPHSSFMASICMPMCDYESSAPVCEHQVCRACRTDIECIEELSIFEAHPQDFSISCDIPTGKCLKRENKQ